MQNHLRNTARGLKTVPCERLTVLAHATVQRANVDAAHPHGNAAAHT